MANSPHIPKVGAHSNQETQPCDSSSSGPTVAPVSQPRRTVRKRKRRTLSAEHQIAQSEHFNHCETQAKRQKLLSCTSSSSSTTSSSIDSSSSSWDRTQRCYWDSLSRVWLTLRAVRELDRRDSLLRASAPPNTQTILTRKQHSKDITEFARRGGPDLSDIRNVRWSLSIRKCLPLTVAQHPDPEDSSATTTNSKPKSTKARDRCPDYDRNFEQLLTDKGMSTRRLGGPRAVNHVHWSDTLEQPRPSLSPSRMSDGEYHRFVRAVDESSNHDEIMALVVPKIVGRDRYPSRQEARLTNLDPLIEGIAVPQPDYYEGSSPRRGNRQLRRLLDTSIVPSSHGDSPFLPNISLEAQGQIGSFNEATLQSYHDGALFSRGAHRVENLGRDEEVFDNEARTVSALYHGEGDLVFHTHHLSQPDGPGTSPQTHMTRLHSFDLTDSPQSFRRGAWRNASDYAHKHRERLIADAYRRATIITVEPSTTKSRSSLRRPLSRQASIVRRPLACQATYTNESSDCYPSSSSEDDDSEDGTYGKSLRLRRKRKLSKREVVTIVPKRPATSIFAGRRSTLRRRTRTSFNLDSDSSSEDEPSRGRPRPDILVATPGRPATRSPSISRQRLRPRTRI